MVCATKHMEEARLIKLAGQQLTALLIIMVSHNEGNIPPPQKNQILFSYCLHSEE